MSNTVRCEACDKSTLSRDMRGCFYCKLWLCPYCDRWHDCDSLTQRPNNQEE